MLAMTPEQHTVELHEQLKYIKAALKQCHVRWGKYDGYKADQETLSRARDRLESEIELWEIVVRLV